MLPRLPVRARHQFRRGIVVEDALCFRVPSQLAANHHGDQTQVAGNRRVMRRLDRGDRRLARFDAVEEVPVVVGRPVEFDFALVFGQPGHVLEFLF